MQVKKRKSGLSLVDSLPWGSHFCQFYKTKEDLLDILIPYFKAGLENNESCVWVTGSVGPAAAKKALEKAVPGLDGYAGKGQVEIIPASRWEAEGGGALDTRLEKAARGGFAGVRLACDTASRREGEAFSFGRTHAARRNKIISLFCYQRDVFDAPGLMEVVQMHDFALIRNAGGWEVIESAEARTRNALKKAEEKVQHLASFPQLNPNPVLEVNLKGKITFSNAAAAEYLREMGIGNDKGVFLPEDMDVILSALRLVSRTQTFYREVEIEGRTFAESIYCSKKLGVVRIYATDITERKKAEDALRESEQRVRLKLDSILSPEGDIGGLELGDIIDVPALQSKMESFYKISRFPMAIIDVKGKVLVGAGWQRICTKFHRTHPETSAYCIESDTQLSAGIPAGEVRLYKCKNNLWDIATPIFVGGRHVGNIFSGQFFFEDEAIDYELFRAQAKRYGFDEKQYIAALDAVPRISREFLDAGMSFLMQLADTLSQLGYSNVKLAKSLAERDALTASLRRSREALQDSAEELEAQNEELRSIQEELEESRRQYEDLYNFSPVGYLTLDKEGAILRANVTGAQMIEDGIRMVGKSFSRFLDMKEKLRFRQHVRDTLGSSLKTVCELRLDAAEGPLWVQLVSSREESGSMRTAVIDISERKRAEDALRLDEERLESLLKLTQMKEGSEKALADQALEEVVRITGSKAGYLHFFSEDRQEISLNSWSADVLKNCAAAETRHYPLEKAGIWADCIRLRRPVIHNNYEDVPEKKGLPAGHFPITRHMSVPVFDEGRIIGIVGVGNKEEPYGDSDINQLMLYMNSMWGIIKRRRAEEALRREKEKSELLADSAAMLLTTETPERIVQGIAEMVMKLLDCHAFFNYLVEGDSNRLRLNAWHGVPEATAKEIEHLDFGVAVCGCVARDGCRIIAEDIPNTPDRRTDLVRSFGIQAYACHPLKYQGKTIGTLSFGTKSRPHFTEDEIELMNAVTDLVATAMARKRTEEAVLHAKEEWERTFDSVPDLVAVMDRDHRILRVNRAMAERLGKKPEECAGRVCYMGVHGTDRPHEFCPHVLTMLDGKEHAAEVHEDRLGGDFLVTTTPLLDERGRIAGSVHVARDITARKAIERQRADLLAMLTHDFKSPLTTIIGYTELMLARGAEAETASMLKAIEQGSSKILGMVQDFLTISKMESGSLELRKRAEDAGGIVGEIERAFAPRARNKGIRFTAEAEEGLPGLLVDRKHLERAITNLVENALSYTQEGGEVSLKVGRHGGGIAVSVMDTGMGIPAEEQGRVFDKYYRSSKTAGMKGTGLGLAIVKAVAEAHGGRVELESDPGKGSVFKMILPLTDAGAQPET